MRHIRETPQSTIAVRPRRLADALLERKRPIVNLRELGTRRAYRSSVTSCESFAPVDTRNKRRLQRMEWTYSDNPKRSMKSRHRPKRPDWMCNEQITDGQLTLFLVANRFIVVLVTVRLYNSHATIIEIYLFGDTDQNGNMKETGLQVTEVRPISN